MVKQDDNTTAVNYFNYEGSACKFDILYDGKASKFVVLMGA